jgi:hypothetical protein
MDARADLLLTKLYALEKLFFGTAVAYAPREVGQVAPNIKSIRRADSIYLIDIITFIVEIFLYVRRLYRERN